jgi:magnesium chelatase family protein
VSGPLRDRIDIQIEVPGLPPGQLLDGMLQASESSASVRARVDAAWERQLERQRTPNARLAQSELARHCRLPPGGRALLDQALSRLGLSARGFHRILRVARTIADLDGSEAIAQQHLVEAIGYRRLDRG